MRWTAELIVGIVVLAALLLFGYFSIHIGKLSWEPPQRWTVRFDDVSGLKEGDPVLALGARVGKVERLEFGGDHVVAHLVLHTKVDLYEDYAITLRAPSILASYHVFVMPGSPTKARVASHDGLRGTSGAGLLAEAVRGALQEFKGEDGTLGKLLIGAKGYDDLSVTLERARQFSETLEKADGALGRLLVGEKALEDFTKTLENARELSTDLAQKDGALGHRLLSDATRQDLEKALANLSELGERLKKEGGVGRELLGPAAYDTLTQTATQLDKGDGQLGKLILGDKPHADLAATLENAKGLSGDLKDGDGALGQLLVGKKSYASFTTTLDKAGEAMNDVRELAAKANKGEGTLGRLLNDGAVYEDLKKVMDTLRQVAADVSEGKGTLGKLVTDSGLYDTANKIVKQISEAIEEAREQAPVTSFTSTLFGGMR